MKEEELYQDIREYSPTKVKKQTTSKIPIVGAKKSKAGRRKKNDRKTLSENDLKKQRNTLRSRVKMRHLKLVGLPSKPYKPIRQHPENGDYIVVQSNSTDLHINSSYNLRLDTIKDIIRAAFKSGIIVKNVKYNNGKTTITHCQCGNKSTFSVEGYVKDLKIVTCDCAKKHKAEPISDYGFPPKSRELIKLQKIAQELIEKKQLQENYHKDMKFFALMLYGNQTDEQFLQHLEAKIS